MAKVAAASNAVAIFNAMDSNKRIAWHKLPPKLMSISVILKAFWKVSEEASRSCRTQPNQISTSSMEEVQYFLSIYPLPPALSCLSPCSLHHYVKLQWYYCMTQERL